MMIGGCTTMTEAIPPHLKLQTEAPSSDTQRVWNKFTQQLTGVHSKSRKREEFQDYHWDQQEERHG